jgi:hypothetical protein
MVWRAIGTVVGCLIASLLAGRPADAQTPTPVSVSTNGTLGNEVSDGGVFSGDGKIVAFSSRATNLVAGDTNGSQDVFVSVSARVAGPVTARLMRSTRM